MIVGKLMSFLVTLATTALGTLPTVPVPGWLTGNSSAFVQVFAFADSMSVWFPGSLVLTILAAYLSIRAVGLAIKVARIVASFLTGGGGSAA